MGDHDGRQWRSQPYSLSFTVYIYGNFKVLSLFISLEIDCFHEYENIFKTGLNRRAGYATD